MSRNEIRALIAAAAAIGLSMTPADAGRLTEPIGMGELMELVDAHPEIDQAVFPGLSAAPLLMGGKKVAAPGAQQWTNAGTYSFVVPDGVSSICAVAVSGGGSGSRGNYSRGGAGGGGGGLGWKNNIPVSPGEALTINVGAGGVSAPYALNASGSYGGDSSILRSGNYLLWVHGGDGG